MLPIEPHAYLCFDPRDLTQDLDNRATWKPTENAILISATMLLAAQGENCRICWDKVAALADLCDAAEGPGATATSPRHATREETDGMLRTALQRRPKI